MGAWIGGMWIDAPGSPCPTCDCHMLEGSPGEKCGAHPQCQPERCVSCNCRVDSHFETSAGGRRAFCMSLGCHCERYVPPPIHGPPAPPGLAAVAPAAIPGA